MNWIDSNENLPETNQIVLVWDSSVSRATIGYKVDSDEDDSTGISWWAVFQKGYGLVVHGNIKYWMPLPSQPTGGAK